MARRSPMLPAEVVVLAFAAAFSALLSTSAAATPPPYTNHTVGGPVGWFFNSSANSAVYNYSSWASTQSFFLGDYLIFNTNSNTTVIQTYNATTYRLCDISGDDGVDTSIFYGGGTGGPVASLTVAVPLTEEGPNYYLSDANDGIQCFKGMRFKISVAHGRGLPPSLNQPPPPPYVGGVPPPPEATAASDGTGQAETFYRGSAAVAAGLSGFGFGGAFLLLLVLAM